MYRWGLSAGLHGVKWIWLTLFIFAHRCFSISPFRSAKDSSKLMHSKAKAGYPLHDFPLTVTYIECEWGPAAEEGKGEERW
jgi:hypothetical protein